MPERGCHLWFKKVNKKCLSDYHQPPATSPMIKTVAVATEKPRLPPPLPSFSMFSDLLLTITMKNRTQVLQKLWLMLMIKMKNIWEMMIILASTASGKRLMPNDFKINKAEI